MKNIPHPDNNGRKLHPWLRIVRNGDRVVVKAIILLVSSLGTQINFCWVILSKTPNNLHFPLISMV